MTTSSTWITALTTIHELGGHCQFVNIDPSTAAIPPIHIYGNMVTMDRVAEIARLHNLSVIEDAFQTIGTSSYRCAAGTSDDAGYVSFHTTKLVGVPCNGGLLVTARADWHESSPRRATALWDEALIRHQARVPSHLPALAAPLLQTHLADLTSRIRRRQQQWQRQRGVEGIVGVHIHVPTAHVQWALRNCIILAKANIEMHCRQRNYLWGKSIPKGAPLVERMMLPQGAAISHSLDLVTQGLALPLKRQISNRQIDRVISRLSTAHQATPDAARHAPAIGIPGQSG